MTTTDQRRTKGPGDSLNGHPARSAQAQREGEAVLTLTRSRGDVLLLESAEMRHRRLHREWWNSLPVDHRAKIERRIKAKESCEKQRREVDNLLIQIMVCREHLARESYSWESASERARKDAATREELSRAQFAFEKLMVRRLKLDFLNGVGIYGIKRRRPAWETKKPAATQRVPTTNAGGAL